MVPLPSLSNTAVLYKWTGLHNHEILVHRSPEEIYTNKIRKCRKKCYFCSAELKTAIISGSMKNSGLAVWKSRLENGEWQLSLLQRSCVLGGGGGEAWILDDDTGMASRKKFLLNWISFLYNIKINKDYKQYIIGLSV